MNNIATIISARMNSRRLPGKAMLPLAGIPMIDFLIRRISKTIYGGPVILATSNHPSDDLLCEFAFSKKINTYRGPLNDVALRHIELAKKYNLEWIIRITADCPFLDSHLIDYCLTQLRNFNNFDLATTKSKFPVGLDLEVFSVKLLKNEWHNMSDQEKEHLTLRFYNQKLNFKIKFFTPPDEFKPTEKIYTVDTKKDYNNAKKIVDNFGRIFFSTSELLASSKEYT